MTNLPVDPAALVRRLCGVLPDRRPGSTGNDQAVDLVGRILSDLGWQVDCPAFAVIDWDGGPGSLAVGELSWLVAPSPYATGWHGVAPIHPVASEVALAADHVGAILLLHGDLTAAPLTPNDYPFYGSQRDRRIVNRLEACQAHAILAITGRCPELAGSLDPFPLIEDGTFGVPTGNLSTSVGAEVLRAVAASPDTPATLDLPSRRWPTTARNVLARRGDQADRITVIAHIDSKPGTPGAVDNASGVAILVRVAELLADMPTGCGIELVAVNGEDYYAASGEVDYLASTDLSQVRLAINVDGAGFRGSPTAYSTYNLPAGADLATLAGLVAGPPWPQSDHMLFAMAGRPAIAITSSDSSVLHDVAHSPQDTPHVVDPQLLEQAARAIAELVLSWG